MTAAIATDVPTALLIGGTWTPASDGRAFAVDDPATEQTLAVVADGTAADARACLDAACDAAPAWRRASPRTRADVLAQTLALLDEERERFAILITSEMGKPLAEARAEVDYAAEFLRWFAEEAVRVDGRVTTAPRGGRDLLVTREPVGPALLITPWNFPLAMAARKVAAALAAGCTAVLKPAPETPLTALAFAALLQRAGLPAGVLNLLTTTDAAGTTRPLLEDPRLRKLSFTGSTAVGRHLLARAADGVLRTSMELGGNAPALVFADADLDAAVEGVLEAKMRNMGEACTAANRLLVQRPVAEAFAARLTERMGALRVGHGLDPDTDVGPLITARQRARVAQLVAQAVADGADLLCGGDGAAAEPTGHFFAPTVLADVPSGASILREEIFGPVAPILVFDDEDEAIVAANDTEHGLVGYVFSGSLERGLRVARALDAGMVGVNHGVVSNPAAPFGGRKASGHGREGGPEGIAEYLETKYTAVTL